MTRCRCSGRLPRITGRGDLGLAVEPRSARTLALPASVADPADAAREYLEVPAGDGSTAYWYFVGDTALRVVPPARALSVDTAGTTHGYDVTVTAKALVRDLMLFPDRLDPLARVDTGLVALSAGQIHTFHVSGAPAPGGGPVGVPVLRCVNDLLC